MTSKNPPKPPFESSLTSLFWPVLAVAEANAAFTRQFVRQWSKDEPPPEPAAELDWLTPNRIALQLHTARLRDFSAAPQPNKASARPPVLVCAPFSMHGAHVADLCPDHSLMAALRAAAPALFLLEWLSASPEQRFRRIDDFLADLNVMVDELGGRVDLIGLCQGGWLGLIYAARFPGKVRKLVLAGAPVDIDASESALSRLTRLTPIETFKDLVELGGGLMRGAQTQLLWPTPPETPEKLHDLLQSREALGSPQFVAQAAIFAKWNSWTLDLPGAYFLEVVERIFKNNELAKGEFLALGQRIDLKKLNLPLYLLLAQADEVTAKEQAAAVSQLVGTPAARLKAAPGRHLSLFMGRQALEQFWPDVMAWLGEGEAAPAKAKRSRAGLSLPKAPI